MRGRSRSMNSIALAARKMTVVHMSTIAVHQAPGSVLSLLCQARSGSEGTDDIENSYAGLAARRPNIHLHRELEGMAH